MSRTAKVFAMLLVCLLFDEALGQQTKGNLVFCKRLKGEAGTYLANPDGGDQRRVLFLWGPEVSPRLAPDGKSVLFSLVKGGKSSVWIVNRDGEGRKEICEGDQATWSPDGTTIFFRRAGQIVQRVLASGKEEIVSPPSWKSCAFPDCAPDGKRILFIAQIEGRAKLVVTTLERQRPRPLADLGVASPGRWSPEGDRIAYSDGAHVFIMGAGGSWKYRLTTSGGVERNPAWSPDGTMLVYCHAPTLDAGWSLCAAKADGTQARVLPREDNVVSFFAPDWRGAGAKPAVGVRVPSRVAVWDIGEQPAQLPDKFDQFLKKREGWKRLSGTPVLKGGVVVENQQTLLLAAPKVCPLLLFQKQADAVELVPVSTRGEEARTVESLKLVKTDAEQAVVEVTTSTASGKKLKTSWRVNGAGAFVQVSPVQNAGSLRIRTPLKYVVVPDRFADDLVYDSASYPGTRIALPGAPLVLGLAGSGESVVAIACPSAGHTMDLLRDAGPSKSFSGAEIRLAKTPLSVGLLTGQGLWYEARPNAKYERRRMDLNWEVPGAAMRRLAVRVAGRVYSDMFMEKDSPRLDGKKLFLTDQEEFAGLVDLALVYLYGRSPTTPLDQWTPLDLALDGMGMESFAKAIDIEGLQSYRAAPRPTTWANIFDSLQGIRVLYEREVEVKEKLFVEHLCDDVPAFLDGMEGRLDEFAVFARQVAELAKTWEKKLPQAPVLLAAIKPALDKLEEACKKRDKLPAAAEAVRCAVQIKEITAKDMKDRSDKQKKFSELCNKVLQTAKERADLIKAFRSSAKELRDRAGISCAERPELRAPATKLRELAGAVLRNRYYFEADWRGEPHRVAPYWLAGRPY